MGAIKQYLKDFAADQKAWMLMIVFFCVQAVMFYQTGMVTTLEAEKYIREGAELAANGNLTETRFVFYLPVILLVAVCRLLHISLYFVIIVQVLLSAIALHCFYRVAAHLSTRTWALGIALLLAVCTPVQQWNMYVYSDSLFISLSIIFFSVLYFININKTFNWRVLLIIPLVWCFARPAGLLFVLPMFVLLFTIKAGKKWVLFAALGALLLMIIAAAAYFNGGGDLDTLKPYIEEHIICFVPQNPGGANIDIVHTNNQLNDLFYYIMHNPGHFISLLAQKLVSFFNLTRPWYSFTHNMAMVLLMLPVYLFFIPGIIRLFRTHRSYAWFIIAVLIIYPVGVVLQCDDWHNRFTMPVFPLIMLTAFMDYITWFITTDQNHNLYRRPGGVPMEHGMFIMNFNMMSETQFFCGYPESVVMDHLIRQNSISFFYTQEGLFNKIIAYGAANGTGNEHGKKGKNNISGIGQVHKTG